LLELIIGKLKIIKSIIGVEFKMWTKSDKIIVILLVILAILNFLVFIINPAFANPEKIDVELTLIIMTTFGIIFEVLIITILIIMIRKE